MSRLPADKPNDGANDPQDQQDRDEVGIADVGEHESPPFIRTVTMDERIRAALNAAERDTLRLFGTLDTPIGGGQYDREGKPIGVGDWVALRENRDYVVIAVTHIGKHRISTVWLGLDYGMGGPLQIFETMVSVTEVSATDGHTPTNGGTPARALQHRSRRTQRPRPRRRARPKPDAPRRARRRVALRAAAPQQGPLSNPAPQRKEETP